MDKRVTGKIRRFGLVLVLWTGMLVLPGCWDRVEVNDLAFVMGAGLDQKKDKMIELTVLVFIPKGGGGSQEMGTGSGSGSGGSMGSTMVRSASGITIAQAMSKLQEKLPRRIFWGHSHVFVMSEDIARKGIAPHIDFLLRHPQTRERTYIFVSKQKAKDVLGLLPPLERDISEVLRELDKLKIGIRVTTKDLAEMLNGDSGDAAIPWIEINPSEPESRNHQKIAYITGTAVFKKDKMVGRLNDSVTRGVLWLRNELKTAIVTVQPKGAGGPVSMQLLRANSELIPSIRDGTWKITCRAETVDDIIQNSTNWDLMNPEFDKRLEVELQREIGNRVRAALNTVQKNMKADIFGFAEAFHRKYPDLWRKEKDHWGAIFPTVEVSIETRASIRRSGMTSVPGGLPEQEVKQK